MLLLSFLSDLVAMEMWGTSAHFAQLTKSLVLGLFRVLIKFNERCSSVGRCPQSDFSVRLLNACAQVKLICHHSAFCKKSPPPQLKAIDFLGNQQRRRRRRLLQGITYFIEIVTQIENISLSIMQLPNNMLQYKVELN